MSIKILVVDDHPFTRAGIRAIIETNKSIEVVGEAVDGIDAISKVKEKQPSIVIIDITMPNLSGIEATKEILRVTPGVKIIALSMHSSEQFVKEMLNAGAAGYLLKDEAPEDLLRAIEKVEKGEMYLSSSVIHKALKKTKKREDFGNPNILQTKLHRPPIMDDYISREKIVEKLENNIYRPLSIISAATGYGKSVTVSGWLDQTRFLHTWLSIDEEHNDFRTFLLYLCAAIEKLFPGSLENTSTLLTTGDLPPFKVIFNSLINELCNIDIEFILVLDDYHIIRERNIHRLFDEWLQFPPPKVHLSIISRRDPPLNIKALRASSRITEIRMNDLMFNNKEIISLFKTLLGIDLNAQAVKKLHKMTEGWIIGLRMASLAIKNKDDIDRFIEAVDGEMHYISDYLISEVLSVQPQHIQEQLIESSILNRFCVDLIEEIIVTTNKESPKIFNGNELIQWLIKSNMFVFPLDVDRKWFRYHHLFQELLNNQLRKRRTKKQINQLHIKASEWFEKNDFINEAIDHAITANDENRAVNILIENWEDTFDKDQWYIVKKWLARIPDKTINQSIDLILARLWIAQQNHRVNDIPQLIKLIDQNDGILTEKQAGYLAFGKVMVSLFNDKIEEALDYSQEALDLIPKTHFIFRTDTYGWWTVAMQVSGKGKQAIESANKALKKLDWPGNTIQRSRRTLHPNFVYILSANLLKLRKNIDLFFQIPNVSPYMLSFGWYFRGCVSWWENDNKGAIRNFEQTIKYKYQCRPRVALEAYLCLALAFQELNEPTRANEMMNAGSQYAIETNDPVNISIIDSSWTRLNLIQGNLGDAEKWLHVEKFPDLNPSMLWWVEVPAITQCRVLIAIATTDTLNKALKLLQEYREYSESIFNKLRTIEVAVLQAQTYFKLQNKVKATNTLKYALELAVDGEWIRPFIEVGEELKILLLTLKEQNVKPEFIDEILRDRKQKAINTNLDTQILKQNLEHRKKENLILLTPKELDVLLCIEEGLRTIEIAEKLFNSEGTIKKHISNMFEKLNVRNRLSLIIKAKQIGILKAG